MKMSKRQLTFSATLPCKASLFTKTIHTSFTTPTYITVERVPNNINLLHFFNDFLQYLVLIKLRRCFVSTYTTMATTRTPALRTIWIIQIVSLTWLLNINGMIFDLYGSINYETSQNLINFPLTKNTKKYYTQREKIIYTLVRNHWDQVTVWRLGLENQEFYFDYLLTECEVCTEKYLPEVFIRFLISWGQNRSAGTHEPYHFRQ